MKTSIYLAGIMVSICCGVAGAQRARQTVETNSARALTIISEPNAVVWIDEIRRGTTDAAGNLAGVRVSPGVHTLHVRANGFKESSTTVPSTQRGGLARFIRKPRPSKVASIARRGRPTKPLERSIARFGRVAASSPKHTLA